MTAPGPGTSLAFLVRGVHVAVRPGSEPVE